MSALGFLVVDKPKDWTSYDVVDRAKQWFPGEKIGHGGTLDPLATGVLILAVGKATKYLHYFLNDDKEYLAHFLLGVSTDSQDSTGTIVEEREVPELDKDSFESILDSFRGRIMQTPPMFSAKKVNGKRLYKLARKGIDVQRDPKEVLIHSLALESFDGTQGAFRVACSKGTYVRTLCHDIGQTLGCGAHLTDLVRVRSGHFHLDQAHTVQRLQAMESEERLAALHSISQVVKAYV